MRALALFAALYAPTALAEENGILGTWAGEYICNQGVTGLTLTVQDVGTARMRALFHFYESPKNPGVPEGCFLMAGTVDPDSGTVSLTGGRWLMRPEGYSAVDMSGAISPDGLRFAGSLSPELNCTDFVLDRLTEARPTPLECSPDMLVGSADTGHSAPRR